MQGLCLRSTVSSPSGSFPVLKAHVGMIEILQSKEVYVIQQIAVALHVHGPDLRDVNRIFVGQGAFSQANARGSRDWGSVLV